MKELNFDATEKETKIIYKIAKRATEIFGGEIVGFEMDIRSTHANGCRLDLKKLLNCDDTDFRHDIDGIYMFLNRSTGKLTRCFNPRCSK